MVANSEPALNQSHYRLPTVIGVTGKPILVIYNSRNKEREVSIYLHPLGLVVRDSTIYVVGKTDFASDVRHWALHRFTAVKDHKGPLQRPEGFSLTKWVTDWKMGDYSEAEKVSFWMDEKVAHHLNEMKLSSWHNSKVRVFGVRTVRIPKPTSTSWRKFL
jgi:predicted DNA-binding transcriptional regulator YafY